MIKGIWKVHLTDYIKVEWKQYIIDLHTILEREVYVGIFIDAQIEVGYKVDAQIALTASVTKVDKKQNTKILSSISTVIYIGKWNSDILSRQDVETPFTVPKRTKNIRSNVPRRANCASYERSNATPEGYIR